MPKRIRFITLRGGTARYGSLRADEEFSGFCNHAGCVQTRLPSREFCPKHAKPTRKHGPAREMPVDTGVACVYAIRVGDYVKIGKSWNMRSRVSSFITDTPYEVEVYGAVPAPDWLEEGLHVLLKEHWHRGEWFHWRDEVKTVCDLIRRQERGALEKIAVRLPHKYFR